MTPMGFEPNISWLRTRDPEPLDEGAKEKTACHGKIRNKRLSDNIPYTVCILAGQGIPFRTFPVNSNTNRHAGAASFTAEDLRCRFTLAADAKNKKKLMPFLL